MLMEEEAFIVEDATPPDDDKSLHTPSSLKPPGRVVDLRNVSPEAMDRKLKESLGELVDIG